MTIDELCERIWRSRHEVLKSGRSIEGAHIYISRDDHDGLKMDPDPKYRMDWVRVSFWGIPIVVDERLELGDVRIRWEIAA